MAASATSAPQEKQSFPVTFWTANLTELFERGAYYAMASFVVLYLGQLGSGRLLAEHAERHALVTGVLSCRYSRAPSPTRWASSARCSSAFVLLTLGYFLMGYPVWFGGQILHDMVSSEITAGDGSVASGDLRNPDDRHGRFGDQTVHFGHGAENRGCTRHAGFRHFLHGGQRRFAAWDGASATSSRTSYDLSYIFAVAVGCSMVAFIVVLFSLSRQRGRHLGAT
jgi:hypothetical protein